MAAYKVWRVPLVPHLALHGAGEVKPDADGEFPEENEYRLDERGNPQVFYKRVEPGHVAYTEESDYGSLSDEDKANSTFSPFPGFFKRQLQFEFTSPDGEAFTSVEEVEQKRSSKRGNGAKAAGENKGSTAPAQDSNQ